MFDQRMPTEFYCKQIRDEADRLMSTAETDRAVDLHLSYLKGMTAGFWIAGAITTEQHLQVFDQLIARANLRYEAIKPKKEKAA